MNRPVGQRATRRLAAHGGVPPRASNGSQHRFGACVDTISQSHALAREPRRPSDPPNRSSVQREGLPSSPTRVIVRGRLQPAVEVRAIELPARAEPCAAREATTTCVARHRAAMLLRQGRGRPSPYCPATQARPGVPPAPSGHRGRHAVFSKAPHTLPAGLNRNWGGHAGHKRRLMPPLCAAARAAGRLRPLNRPLSVARPRSTATACAWPPRLGRRRFRCGRPGRDRTMARPHVPARRLPRRRTDRCRRPVAVAQAPRRRGVGCRQPLPQVFADRLRRRQSSSDCKIRSFPAVMPSRRSRSCASFRGSTTMGGRARATCPAVRKSASIALGRVLQGADNPSAARLILPRQHAAPTSSLCPTARPACPMALSAR